MDKFSKGLASIKAKYLLGYIVGAGILSWVLLKSLNIFFIEGLIDAIGFSQLLAAGLLILRIVKDFRESKKADL